MMCLLEMVCAIVVVVFVMRRGVDFVLGGHSGIVGGEGKGITSIHSEWSVEEWAWFLLVS